jgi:hypothetical protein
MECPKVGFGLVTEFIGLLDIYLYPQKLALTSPTSTGHSVSIVSSRTKATEFVWFFLDVDYRLCIT